MATSRDFNAMLNEYLPVELMAQDLQKRDYVLQKVEKKNDWKGGTHIVPFEGQAASSFEFGQLAGETDVSKDLFVRGQISTVPEVWGTMKFEYRDLIEHDGKIPESTFLKILPNRVDAFMQKMKMTVSVNLLSGSHFATLTVSGTAGGVIEVDRVDRFELSQKVQLYDGNTAAASYYVIAIDVNGGTLGKGSVTLSATRGGAAADVSAYTTGQSAKVYHPGITPSSGAGSFTSIKSQILSLANGGSTNLFGQAKTAYPYLQAVQIDGSSISASNILDKIFDGYSRKLILGKASGQVEVLMSLKHFGSCLKLIEVQKGPFNVKPGSRSTSVYGWDTIEIGSVSGQLLKLVGIQEMDDDFIWFADWTGVYFATNGMIKRVTDPDGNSYHKLRATTGYSFLVDHCLFGDIVVVAPSKQAVIYNIPNY